MDLRVRRLWRFLWLRFGQRGVETRQLEVAMGFLDKLLGRGKKAAGDVMGDSSLRREGAAQERAGAAEDRAARHEELAQEQRNQAAQARTEQEQS
jgi:uncharacterized protein YjbJ (UPF0337 family)